jgi:glycosyltransferase involved in cell wall biosynthesis
MKIMFIASHLSTGGMPQYLYKQIEATYKDHDVYCLEWDNITGGKLTVQRDRIQNLLGDKLITLDQDKHHLLKLIEEHKPDFLHFKELPETFIDSSILEKIYSKNRKYKIIETTHDSSFSTTIKRFMPDKFLFVSAYNAFKYINFDIPYEIVEYPVDQKIPNREENRKKLGFEDDWKHIINVGLFTPRKNQKYLFEIAEKLKDYKIKFHFIGNQADNFKFYWEPLLKNKPSNCIVWGERNDVEDFIQAADLSFFASKGDKYNKELNPIAIKEVLEYNIPMMMFNLDVYCGKYDNNPNIDFLTGDLDKDTQLLIKFLKPEKIQDKGKDEVIIISTYPDTSIRKQLTKECIESFKKTGRQIILVSHYPVTTELQQLVDYYFYDANNVMIHHSFYNRFFNYTDNYNVEVNISALAKTNQSFAAYINLLNGFKLAQQLGFKKVLFAVYDVVLHESDLNTVDNIFSKLDEIDWHAYLTRIHTDVGLGIETTAMGFKVDYFLKTFPYITNPDEFIQDCDKRGCHNFLEHYFMAILKDEVGLWIDPGSTPLPNSGLGKSSTSEYMSILPVENRLNELMFYFFTYNIDDRIINLRVYENENEITNISQKISEGREICKEIYFNGNPLKIIIDRIDNGEIYKSQTFHVNQDNIHEYNNNGIFRLTKKPKIKLIHLQTTNNDEREQISRENLSKLNGILEYKLIQNEPYKGLPPSDNCSRPDCVSMTKFEEGHPLQGQALTPPHYGCFESFKNGILNEFTEDLDFLIVCEGDCLLEVLPTTFIDHVYKACEIINKYGIDYFSFGDTHTLEEGWHISHVVEEIPECAWIFITNKIIGIQCIMFPKHIREYLLNKLKTHPWDAADLYFNDIFSNKKMGIVRPRLTTQVDGYSLIDKSIKTFRK